MYPQKFQANGENFTDGAVNRKRQKHLRCGIRDALPSNSIPNGLSEVNMADGMKRDWRELCLAVTNENDPTKLGSLVQQLIEALDEGERSWRQRTDISFVDETSRARNQPSSSTCCL